MRGCVFLAGKLAYRGFLNAVTPGRLVHVLDQTSNRRFLVDTGASYSIFLISQQHLRLALVSLDLQGVIFLAGVKRN